MLGRNSPPSSSAPDGSSRARAGQGRVKSLVPEDAQQAIGHGVRAKRSKSGAISFDLLKAGGRPCSGPVSRSAALAAALAKAQIELTNPEKSMVATIEADDRRAAEQLFRYAPLSSGLDIVRKTLGQHEIATVQTTAVDQTGELVNLHDGIGAFVGRMDCLGLASLPAQ